jgi:hypothetical protein
MSPAYYFHTTILHPPNSPPVPYFFSTNSHTATNKQTNKQSINQLQQPMSHPQTDRQPNNHKIFLLPMSRLNLLPSNFRNTQNSSTISHRIPILNQPVGVLKIFPDPDYDWWRFANIPTTWVLAEASYYARREEQIHKKRVEIVVTFTFIKLLCGEGLCYCTWLCEEAS